MQKGLASQSAFSLRMSRDRSGALALCLSSASEPVVRQRGDASELRFALYTLAGVLLDRGDLAATTALDDEADALLGKPAK